MKINGAKLVQWMLTRSGDALVVGGTVVGFTGWGAYEWAGQRFNYYDAPLICAGAAVGLPVALAGGAYALRRGLPLHLPAGLSLAALRERLYGRADGEETAVQPPDMSDWVNVVNGLSRARKAVFPIGRRADTGGVVNIDFDETHHLIINGQTGSGKTIAVLRPLAAMAAMSGLFQVVILDKSGRYFRVLEGHPNIHIVRYDHEGLPAIAEGIYAEILRRDQWLARQPGNPTTIDRVRADRRPSKILVIADEYANAAGLLRETAPRLAGRLNTSMIQCVQEGRAMSVHMVIVAQRPDHTQVNTTLRSQLNGLSFHMRDATDARLADTPGAENLPDGQAIFSKPGGRETLAMWYPSDEQLRQALAAETAQNCGQPTWLHGYTPPVTAPVTNSTSHEEPAEVFVTDDGDFVTGSKAVTGRDLGTIACAHTSESVISQAVTPVTAVSARARDFLNDTDPSPIDGLTVGQAQAIAYCLLAGESLSSTARIVFNGKNDRYFETVKAVRQELAGVLGRGD